MNRLAEDDFLSAQDVSAPKLLPKENIWDRSKIRVGQTDLGLVAIVPYPWQILCNSCVHPGEI